MRIERRTLIEQADLRTGKLVPVLRHARVDPEELIWSADGRTLVGAWFHDGKPEPMFIDAEAPEAKLTAAVAAAFPDAWARVVGFSMDRAHALVAVSSDRDPGRYYLFDAATKKLALLTAASPWVDPAKMAPTQVFRFKARDGLEMSGLLTLPRSGRCRNGVWPPARALISSPSTPRATRPKPRGPPSTPPTPS